MIAPEKERCWLIDYLPGEPGDLTLCFPNRVDAEEELARLRKEDGERYALAVVRRPDAVCWTVHCDGECELAINGEEGGLIHFASADAALNSVRRWKWVVTDHEHVFCPEDAPEDGKVPPASPAEQEAAGQLRLPGVMA